MPPRKKTYVVTATCAKDKDGTILDQGQTGDFGDQADRLLKLGCIAENDDEKHED